LSTEELLKISVSQLDRRELFVLQIFAVVCTYLITSIMVTSALEIRIYTFENEELAGELLEFSDFIQKEFHYPYLQNYQYIEIYLSGKDPSYLIKKIYLFRCKGLNPADCMESGIQPVVSVNPGNSDLIFDETYRWDDVSSGNIANFLILTKLDVGGREAWTGSWDRVTKTGIRQFYSEEDLVGKSIVILNNMEPATIRGEESRGMLLAAKDGDALSILVAEKPIKTGSKIS